MMFDVYHTWLIDESGQRCNVDLCDVRIGATNKYRVYGNRASGFLLTSLQIRLEFALALPLALVIAVTAAPLKEGRRRGSNGHTNNVNASECRQK
eukprot:scaffold5528_cov46-Cyclotella_meneghiniana.AAC.3